MSKYEEHEVTYADGKAIFYLAAGPRLGPLIIFMHGWPGIGKTWYSQIDTFASLGFRVIAPDMPGYGRSTARNVPSDYSQENIVQGMLAVLADTGRDQAIWVAHDWGCGTLWTLANTHPQVCRAVAGICVPYGVIELGLDGVIKTANREVYPEDQYPYGQWSYIVFYNQSFDKVTEFFNKEIHGLLKELHRKANPLMTARPAITANVVKDGGWFGGMDSPPPPEATPDESVCMDPEVFEEYVAAMQKTGFGPGNAWYLNFEANKHYSLANSKHDGKLKMPVLFVNARYDSVCDTLDSRLSENMRKSCDNLTETIIDAGHFVATEKPQDLNSAIARWLLEEVADWWPGYWTNGWVKRQVKGQ